MEVEVLKEALTSASLSVGDDGTDGTNKATSPSRLLLSRSPQDSDSLSERIKTLESELEVRCFNEELLE